MVPVYCLCAEQQFSVPTLFGVLDQDFIIVQGDIIAHIVNDSETWRGLTGGNYLNLSGVLLLDFCVEEPINGH